MMDKAALVAFEEDIRATFERAEILAPIHLSDPNQAEALIEIFRDVRPGDWVLSTWRSHYHALLKGVPPEEIRAAIVEGRSIALCFPAHRFLSSAIVGGILPIAVGLAMGIRRAGGTERVWCFVGDMAAETGAFHEATKYAGRHGLPVTWVIEDNGLSTNTDTEVVWGTGEIPALPFEAKWSYLGPEASAFYNGADVRYYRYRRGVPHTGSGKWVTFS